MAADDALSSALQRFHERRHVSASGYCPLVPNEDFWIAVERLVAADDAGADIAALAEDLLDTNGSLGPQLQEAITCLDTSALGRATQLSDGMGGPDDALIAVGCAVIAAGPMVYDEGVRDPESLVRPWDLSRGDLLLALNPGVTLVPVGESTPGRDPYTIDLSIGDSAFGWPRRITEAVTYHQCRRQERNQRWRAIFAQHQFEHLIIHLSAAAGCPQKVGKPYSHHEQYLEVNATWDSPRSPFRLPEFVRTVLDAVATRLERT